MFKTSLYNYFLNEDSHFIYFNGVSSCVFSVTLKEHEQLQLLFLDLISFEINYNSVFNNFVKWGFIVEEDVNEIDIIRYKNKQDVYGNGFYNLVINPTLECNFNCWYCYEEHPKGFMSEDVVDRVIKHISYKIDKERITALHLSWFGGEPLLYFNEVVYPISLYAKEKCKSSNIPFFCSATTNASKINIAMIEKMNLIDLKHFQITIDGTPDKHDKIRNENGLPSFYHIVNNIENICKFIDDSDITLRLNYDEKALKDEAVKVIFDNIPIVYRSKIKPNFQRVWQTIRSKTSENYKRLELHNYCNNLGFKVYSPSNLFQTGLHYKCYADRCNHLEINYDGKIYSCTARDFSDKNVIGILKKDGSVEWDELKRVKRYANATFENDMCLNCRYLPLCLGPCSQKVLETSVDKLQDICCLNITEVSPETVIKDHFYKKMELLKKMDIDSVVS